MKKYQEFNLGDVKLLSGKILNSAKLIYKTYGKLNKEHSNVILLPTFLLELIFVMKVLLEKIEL